MSQNGVTNWKNVNNWHWVEKNCMPWASEFIKTQFVDQTAEKGGVKATLTEVVAVNGDVNINQRKGKLITIYDLEINAKWKGEGPDGVSASGKLIIPEFMHDTDEDDIVYDITVDDESKQTEKIRELVRKELAPKLGKQLAGFSKKMIEANGKDVHIAPEEMKGHPVLQTYSPKPPAPSNASSGASQGKAGVLGGLTTITQKVELVASASDVYETLLDPQRVRVWTRGRADITKEVGKPFNLFEGNITGTIEELVPNKKVVQKWRLKSWPAGHHSLVTIDLQQGDDSTTVHVTQKEVPIGEKDVTENNWKNYYWNSIKQAFGYGALI
ncbi:hypothetical protein HK097_000093 [Rhizophlyctis rosea]|uniref:Activator of Hsp90 ATPase AHSA1-like N-terminal domain-containing protein n=1 Tax=Rhizophlyctis rosea TaxID=64517 RepID=A0AAD5X7Q0_9FUNG|nr:hypothetical protein HK097_000093 [Rhizophlyctis rosea]